MKLVDLRAVANTDFDRLESSASFPGRLTSS